MYCRNCGSQLNDGQEICLKCGFRVGTGKGFCAYCGEPVQDGQAVCVKCGHAIEAPKATASASTASSITEGVWVPAGKDKITAVLLAFFLGGIGIHNFYLGETKKGVVKIVADLFCGLGAILALIDFVKMLLDKYVVDPDAMF